MRGSNAVFSGKYSVITASPGTMIPPDIISRPIHDIKGHRRSKIHHH